MPLMTKQVGANRMVRYSSKFMNRVFGSSFALLSRLAFACAVISAAIGAASAEVPYPFELPAEIQATLHVDRASQSKVNHMLLGLNCSWPENLYGKVGYNHAHAQRLISELDPPALRFPHGVWANFYDWESDGRRITDDYKTPYDSAVKKHPDLLYGFEGLHGLHQQLDFDVLLTFNVNYDSPEKAVRRLADRKAKGFDVQWVELGNEIFWKTQRSNKVVDVEKYIEVSKAHAAALKAAAPDLQLSIPVHWRTAETNPWNLAVKEHHYYDAVTLHKHIHYDEDRDGAAKTVAARQHMIETGRTLRKIFPGLPIWASEWSVSCGENALSVLGMVDVYLGFFDHQELFEVANYFQINAGSKHVAYDKQTGVHTRTSYGAAYQVVREVFDEGEMYASNVESTKIGNGLNAVNATAVEQDGKLIVLAVNKTTKEAPFSLHVDGVESRGPLKHQALTFKAVNELKTFAMDGKYLEAVEVSAGQIVLPPLSINRIEVSSD
jgi:hypothetical protein